MKKLNSFVIDYRFLPVLKICALLLRQNGIGIFFKAYFCKPGKLTYFDVFKKNFFLSKIKREFSIYLETFIENTFCPSRCAFKSPDIHAG